MKQSPLANVPLSDNMGVWYLPRNTTASCIRGEILYKGINIVIITCIQEQ